MYDRNIRKDTDRELIEVLTAISVVSKRLAFKLEQMQAIKKEGGRKNEPTQRTGNGDRRSPKSRRSNFIRRRYSY